MKEEVTIELRPEGRFRINWLKDGWMVGMEEECSQKRKWHEQNNALFIFKMYFIFISFRIFAIVMSSSSLICLLVNSIQ